MNILMIAPVNQPIHKQMSEFNQVNRDLFVVVVVCYTSSQSVRRDVIRFEGHTPQTEVSNSQILQ